MHALKQKKGIKHEHTAVTSWKNCLESPRPAVDRMGALAANAPVTIFGYLILM